VLQCKSRSLRGRTLLLRRRTLASYFNFLSKTSVSKVLLKYVSKVKL